MAEVGTSKVTPKLMCDAIQEADMNENAKNDQVFKLAPALWRDCPLPKAFFSSPSSWEIEIKRVWPQRRTNTMELAQVAAAKRNLHYGQWTGLFGDCRIPFAKRNAEILVVIARGFGRLDAHNYAHLPSALNTLHRLAELLHTLSVSLVATGTFRLASQFAGKGSPPET